MSDAAIFVTVFASFFVLRVLAAAMIVFWIMPRGDRCPNCDAPTLRVRARGFDRLMPWFRASWCYTCNWEGMLRHGELTPPPNPAPRAKQGQSPTRNTTR
jgi:hypothetical protein